MDNKAIFYFTLFTILSSTVSTLKNMFLARKQFKANYIATFIDAMMFATIMKEISSGDGFIFAFAYAIGKTIGAFLGNRIESKMALGILQIDISLNHFDKMVEIADELRDLGYAVETSSVFGYGGKERFKIVVTVSRNELDIVEKVLSSHGYDTPTMIVTDVSNVHGKITIKGGKD